MTVFQPDPTCFAPSNIWLREGACREEVYEPTTTSLVNAYAPCSYAYHGNLGSGPCYPTPADNTYYTDCPESFTPAATGTGYRHYDDNPDKGFHEEVYCCPDAYSYTHYGYDPVFSKTVDGQTVGSGLRWGPGCIARSVEVLRSEIVTVTLATEPELETTTTTWGEDAVLYADAVTVTATAYGYPLPVSTCWGADCPATWTASFPDRPVETPPTAQFTPPPECTDPANLWLVTTSCYVTSPVNGHATPDWLQCTVTQMGGNEFLASSCDPPAPSNAEGSYYAGCPAGYTGVHTYTTEAYNTYSYTDGYYDIIGHSTYCCPDPFDFRHNSDENLGRDITTTHDGSRYGLFVYPMPGCYATSVSALSGKDVPMHTNLATMPWDKRQEQPDFPTTKAWDYERGIMFAQGAWVASTVFMGTHTCYESCSTWISYYYPDSIGGPSPTATPTTTPAESATPTPDADNSDRDTQGSSTAEASPEGSSAPEASPGGSPTTAANPEGSSTTEGSPEGSSTPANVDESGSRTLAQVETVGAMGMVVLVALWLAL